MQFTSTSASIRISGLTLAICLIWITQAPGALAQTASVYRWVDQNGVTHFTDLPPDSADVQNTGISFQRTDPTAVQERVNQNQEAAQTIRQRQTEASQQTAETRRQNEISAKEREERCEQARERNKSYDTAHRLYRQNADGEREYLSDDEIDNARAEAAKSVSDWCN